MKESSGDSKSHSFFLGSFKMTGLLDTRGELRIDGSFEGKIRTESDVFLGDKGSIRGELQCDALISQGTVKGKVRATQRCSLKSTAVMEGEVETAEIDIEKDVRFDAVCRVKNPANVSKEKIPLARKYRKAIEYR